MTPTIQPLRPVTGRSGCATDPAEWVVSTTGHLYANERPTPGDLVLLRKALI